MSDIRDFALLRSKAGNLEVIPLQVEDADSAEPMALKGRAGALLVDLIGIEAVTISLPDGGDPLPVDLPAERVVDVEVQNTDPIPVDLPAEKVVDVEIQNTDPIPVDLPAEKVVDVEVKNTDPIPVDLPAEKVVDVEVKNTDPIPILLQYPWGAGNEDWKPRRGTATIAISGTTSDTQVGYGKDLLRIKIPAEFTGTAIAVEVASASDETPAGIKTDNKIVVSIPIVAGDKGLWIGMDSFAAVLRGLSYFRLVSNDTEVAARAILYELG